MARVGWLALLILVLGVSVQAAEKVDKIVFALKPDKNPEQLNKEKKALEEYLGKELGIPVEAIVPLSTAVIMEGYANGTVDLGYLSSTDLVKAREKKAADLLLVGEINGKAYYNSYWLTLKDKPYKTIADVKGKPVAFASRTSTSGFVVPLWDLKQKGLINAVPTEFFGDGNVYYGTGYVSGVERVLSGAAEACAVSDYVMDKDKHLTPEQKAKLRVLQSQGPVPTHVLAVRETLPADMKAKLKAALLKMNEAPHTDLRDKLFTSKLVDGDAAKHVSQLTEALKLASAVR